MHITQGDALVPFDCRHETARLGGQRDFIWIRTEYKQRETRVYRNNISNSPAHKVQQQSVP